MKINFLKSVIFCVVIIFTSCNESANEIKNPVPVIKPTISHSIIPQPNRFTQSNKEAFSFEQGVSISTFGELDNEKKYLVKYLDSFTNISDNSTAEIALGVYKKMPNHFYSITCEKNKIFINGGSPEAVFNGIQSFRQLLSVNKGNTETPVLLAFTLTDSPKFKWRGMLLDVCRHYFPKEVVMKYIDLLSFYKLNVLHWHLTEDQAWRIAIDAYPNLTETGAWREDVLAKQGELYGGFYSKEDIKEIVKYASERHIQIVPEIEMPGHSSAAIASYPNLSCNGEQISVPNDWGVFKDIYCPTEETFTFLETVLGEVMELFPSDYVHIGGDEAPKTRWEENEYCKNLMKTENLHDFEELQSYFINRIATFLDENGKTIIGWDEILNDELTETAVIQSWRGMEGGKKAVSEGRNAIMSPTSHCYLDYSLKAIDTEKLYHFNPIPNDCTAEETNRILGAECNMWTEHVPDENTLDSKVFPRLIAASEAFWGTNTDYDNFLLRLDNHYPYLEKRNINYGSETVAISLTTKTYKDSILVSIEENLRNASTTYSIQDKNEVIDAVYEFNGADVKIYREGLNKLSVSSGKSGAENNSRIDLNLNVHRWLTAPVDYSVPFSEYYTAGGENGLTDGVLGSLDFRDGHWQGFFGDNIELIIKNPNENKSVSSVSMNFYRYINSWIFPPESVSISVSNDGINWQKIDSFSYPDEDMHKRGQSIIPRMFSFNSQSTSFLKVNIKNIGTVPDWHEAASEPAWIFIDEVIVK